jgi:hypothetical protein
MRTKKYHLVTREHRVVDSHKTMCCAPNNLERERNRLVERNYLQKQPPQSIFIKLYVLFRGLSQVLHEKHRVALLLSLAYEDLHCLGFDMIRCVCCVFLGICHFPVPHIHLETL